MRIKFGRVIGVASFTAEKDYADTVRGTATEVSACGTKVESKDERLW